MDYLDYDEDLIGEAPCEFCGDLFPLCLLIEHQSTHLNEDQYYLEDFNLPEVVAVNEKATIEPKKEEKKQMLGSISEIKEVIPVQALEISNQISDSKESNQQTIKNCVTPSQPVKVSRSSIETKKIHHKNYHSGIEEFTTEKGEKLLVYGADIDPIEDLESEKQSKTPNNPLLNTITKEEDVIDINSLSDDDSDESLEEFWKRARDFLKRNRGKI